jgi:hypothetical protein
VLCELASVSCRLEWLEHVVHFYQSRHRLCARCAVVHLDMDGKQVLNQFIDADGQVILGFHHGSPGGRGAANVGTEAV